uniref:Uncharacterized protein n=1 Tax=Cyprinodon variegatus TaxID=28743 RepID=A0A3Q2DWV8_CYPVA
KSNPKEMQLLLITIRFCIKLNIIRVKAGMIFICRPKALCKSTPLSELLEWDTVRESLPADTDSLQNTVTPQLVQNKVRSRKKMMRYLISFICPYLLSALEQEDITQSEGVKKRYLSGIVNYGEVGFPAWLL